MIKIIALTTLSVLILSLTTPGPEKPASRDFHALTVEEKYEFIHYKENKLDFFGQSKNWKNLFDKMEKLAFEGSGRISIVHMGGSHVQGGFLPDKIRYNLTQMLYGAEGERGLVFPYELAKTNSPRSIKTKWTGKWTGCRSSVSSESCSWGMSGINATTYDKDASLTMRVFNYDSVAYQFDEVLVYSSAGKSGSMQVNILNSQQIETDETLPYKQFKLSALSDSLELRIFVADSTQNYFTLEGLYLRNSRSGLTYNAIGVNGASTGSYLKCERMDEQLETLQADLVIFGIGVNDANVPEKDFNPAVYEARYDSLIAKYKRVNPNTCFLFVTNNDTYYQKSYPNRNAIQVRETMVRLAEKHNGAVYDFFGIMGGLGSIKKWQNESLAAHDKIHLSKKGYELQADMMSIAIREAFGHYLDKKDIPN